MWKKWTAVLVLFLAFSIPAMALSPEDISLRDLTLFLNGTRVQEKAVELNGEYYVPLKLLEEEFGASATVIGSLMKLEMGGKAAAVREPREDRGNTGSSGNNQGSRTSGHTRIPPSAPGYDDYHAGMIRGDLERILSMLDQLEELSKEYKTLIYAHLNNITQGQSTKKAAEKLSRLEDDYDALHGRYRDMIREIEKLDMNDRDADELADELLDDLDEIFGYKEDALDHLMRWVEDKDEDDMEDYEDADRKANRLIDDVRDYVEGTLDELDEEIEKRIDP